MRHDADALVVGAGPAGSTLARLLAVAGLRVLVLDREPGPVFKIGESLLPAGVALCHELGLTAELLSGPYLTKYAARFVLTDSGEEERYPFAEGLRGGAGRSAYQVKRADFDALLQRHACAGGAEFRFGARVTDIGLDDERATVLLESGERLQAAAVVDASGQGHLLSRRLGLRTAIPGLAKVGLFSHFEGLPRRTGEEEGDITVLWNADYWVWVIPFKDGTTSMGVVGDPAFIQRAGKHDDERFANLCAASASHRELLAARRQLFPLQRRADFSYECARLAGPRFVLVGDAAGFIDPLFSTGVFLAQQSAFLAARALVPALRANRALSAEEQHAYTTTQHTAIRRFLALVKSSYENRLIETAVRSRRRRGMRSAFISLLAGDVFDEANPLIGMGVLANIGSEPASTPG